MNRWYRQSLPGRGLFVVFLTLVLLSDLSGIGVWWAWGRVLDPVEAWIHTLPFLVIGPVLCVVASMCVAAARVMRFPTRRSDYFEWLATTPWQSSRRTPFGPWYPVVQDIIPVGAITGLFVLHIGALQHLNASAEGIPAELGWTPNMFRLALLLPVVAFWVAWTLCSFLAVCSDWKWSVYVPFLCISLLWHLALRVPVEASFIAVLLSFAAGTFAVCRRMLTVLKSLPSRHLTANDEAAPTRKSSPVVEFLRPQFAGTSSLQSICSRRATSFQAGLSVFVWLTLFPWEQPVHFFLPLGVLILGWIRVIVYAEKLHSHIGIAARWATRRFIVSEYDRVWLPTFWMCVASTIGIALTELGAIPINVAAGLAVAIPVVIGLWSGPDHEEWWLTTPARYFIRKEPQSRNAAGLRQNGA